MDYIGVDMGKYEDILGDVLFSTETISTKVAEIGAKITEDYAEKSLVVVGVLKGATVFIGDLIRQIDLPLKLDYSELIVYGDGIAPQSEVVLAQKNVPE